MPLSVPWPSARAIHASREINVLQIASSRPVLYNFEEVWYVSMAICTVCCAKYITINHRSATRCDNVCLVQLEIVPVLHTRSVPLGENASCAHATLTRIRCVAIHVRTAALYRMSLGAQLSSRHGSSLRSLRPLLDRVIRLAAYRESDLRYISEKARGTKRSPKRSATVPRTSSVPSAAWTSMQALRCRCPNRSLNGWSSGSTCVQRFPRKQPGW